ncbi:MAG: hypothetical protein ABIC95_06380 [archaeon]
MTAKRGNLGINYIFAIFVSLIVVFVIIALVSNWAFDANKLFAKIFPSEDDSNLLDRQIIEVPPADCDRLESEVAKHGKICYTKARQGKVEGTDWALCYGIVSDCPASAGQTYAGVETLLGDTLATDEMDIQSTGRLSNNVLVGYDYSEKRVTIS